MKVAVVGQGYVGLPLAIAAAGAGHNVVGVDINERRIALLSQGISPVEDISDAEVSNHLSNRTYFASADFELVSECEIVAICVPTPLRGDKTPDLSALKSSVESVAKLIRPGTLVVIESTVEPGTTRDLVFPLLVSGSGLKESDIDLAFSPERIDPANKKYTITNTCLLYTSPSPRD